MIANGYEGFQDLQDPMYIYGPSGLSLGPLPVDPFN